MTNTRQLIAAITNAGLFERLAASTLRIADPIYEGLCETGTNPAGQTIRDPADGVVFVRTATSENYAIIVHHTITAKNNLKSKWLSPKSGDIAKAVEEFKNYTISVDKKKRKLVLSCSCDPDSNLVAEVEASSIKHGIEIEIWSGSRIAHTLDIKPDGQWVRAQFFNLPQRQLSIDLIREIGANMLNHAQPSSDPEEYVNRDVFEQLEQRLELSTNLVFVCGRSGLGKSVACYELGKTVLNSGGAVIVLPEEAVASALTLEDALQRALKAYCPDLSEPNIIQKSLSILNDRDALIWVEDINRNHTPLDLAQKLLRWTRLENSNYFSQNSGSETGREFKIVCPIWPDLFSQLSSSIREKIDAKAIFIESFNEREGSAAVSRRAEKNNQNITALQAQNAAATLGYDPLLIGLVENWNQYSSENVISYYIDSDVRKLSIANKYQVSEIQETIDILIISMLNNRRLSANWKEAITWMPSKTAVDILRCIVSKSSIINLSSTERIQFRHDRVRDHLLGKAIAERLSSDNLQADEILCDPFFAKITGESLLCFSNLEAGIECLSNEGSLALFHGFAEAVRQSHPNRLVLYEACRKIIDAPRYTQRTKSERYAINLVLSELDGEDVLSLLMSISEPCFAKTEGLARNGQAISAARFCYHHGPSVISPRRDRLITHILSEHGTNFLQDLSAFLSNSDISDELLEGGLFLAGELGNEKLITALKVRWNSILKAESPLTGGMLFAVVTCAAERDNNFADEVLAVWSSLPEEEDDKKLHKNPRFEIAESALSGGIQRHETERVISYLLFRRILFKNLRTVIDWVLAKIDHPIAVGATVITLAEIDRKCEETGGFNMWGTLIPESWGGEDKRFFRRLGEESRAKLKIIWLNEGEEQFLRKRAFSLWSANLIRSDLTYLSNNPPIGLEDEALVARLKSRDQSAKHELAEKIEAQQNDRHWLQYVRYIGTFGLERIIEDILLKRRDFLHRKDQSYFNADIWLPELLADRDDRFSADLLQSHWDHLSYNNDYIATLLYLARPETLKIAEDTINKSDDPKKIFEHITSRLGYNTNGRAGLKRIAQADALLPYVSLFSEYALWSFWDQCNDRGWFEWRKKNIDPLIHFPIDRGFARFDEQQDFERLDQSIKKRFSRSEAYFWSERHLEAGMTKRDILIRAERYAKASQISIASDFFANVVAEHGDRSDLDRLSALPNDGEGWAAKLSDVNYAVRLRSST